MDREPLIDFIGGAVIGFALGVMFGAFLTKL